MGAREVGEDIVGWISAVPGLSVSTGLGVVMGSEMRLVCGTGRRRLRMEVAADVAEMGSVTTRCRGGVAMGKFGGEGGGECW
jgi:hypothetical protein